MITILLGTYGWFLVLILLLSALPGDSVLRTPLKRRRPRFRLREPLLLVLILAVYNAYALVAWEGPKSLYLTAVDSLIILLVGLLLMSGGYSIFGLIAITVMVATFGLVLLLPAMMSCEFSTPELVAIMVVVATVSLVFLLPIMKSSR